MQRKLWGSMLIVAMMGCGGGDGGAGSGGSGGTGGAGGTGGTGGGPRTVTGTAIHTYHSDTGEMQTPEDLSMVNIAALVPNGVDVATLMGAGKADGTFTIPNVPQGTYLLQYGIAYYMTDSSTIDLGDDHLGRSDAVPPVNSTPVVLNLSNLSPWQPADDLQIFSANAGCWWDLAYDGVDVLPTANATSTSNMTTDWSNSYYATNLLDAARGDSAYLFQLSSATSSTGLPYIAASRSLTTSVTMQDGVMATISGALTAVPQQSTIHLNWPRASGWHAHASEISPMAMLVGQTFAVDAMPGGLDKGRFSATPDLLLVQPTDASDQDFGTLAYANPFPASWGLQGIVDFTYTVGYQLPGTTTPYRFVGYLHYEAPLATFDGSPLLPTITPVLQPKVNGMSAFTAAVGVGTTPTLSWSPPATGQPDRYSIWIYRLYVNGTATVHNRVAFFQTPGSTTQLKIPPNFLQTGQSYVFGITASAYPGSDATQHPYRMTSTIANASTLTAIITP